MKIKFKRLISFLALTFCFCLVIGAGYTVARYAGVFDAGEFFLSLGIGNVDPGEAYTLYYHTFDENRSDYVYKQETVYENIPFEIDGVPVAPNGANSGLTFLGWTPQGMWTADEYNLVNGSLSYENDSKYAKYTRVLKNQGDVVNVADLRPDTTTKEVHLYDLYEELYVLVTASNNSNFEYQIYTYPYTYIPATSSEVSNSFIFLRLYEVSGGIQTSNNKVYFALNRKNIKHYMHPGIYYRIGQDQYHDPSGGADGGTRYYTNFYDATGTTNLISSGNFTTVLFTDTFEYLLKISTATNSCFASGTLITMADGTKLPIEMLSQGDLVRVYDHENGCYTSSPILFTEYDGDKEWNVINLEFSDGTRQKFIYEHGLFDLDLKKYVYITEENYQDFIGHRFAKEEDFGYSEVTLTNAYTQIEYTGCYSLTTEYHLNIFVNGMFSMPGGITGLFNFFEYDENLAYDKELMAQDIETYGLFTYDDFAPYMSEETFNTIFPIKYLKVSIGKGLVTFEDLEYIIERYIYRHGLGG